METMFSRTENRVVSLDVVETLNKTLHERAHISTAVGETRLDRLVAQLLDLDDEDGQVLQVLGEAPGTHPGQSSANFHAALQLAIRELKLADLFCTSEGREHHRSICPAAYDERSGTHHPVEMAQWRARYRAMAPEQQMMTATIIWLYQSGRDSTWLRRVPCTWRAIEALHYMRDTGCLSLWVRLIATCPGW
ncbi:hypothetical protein [Paraburkholderia pallida]|uniref:Uncharacterized protein n=1 Tax=Paraburkholderia pallida TaxID=2547399 RepID=A0A4P7CXK1_9BURK|nr:hypothetical protein [Paraburkholderia pallida]QBR00188.1 hypothetical protein E1956_24250 [Paraburkholderia pallida]